VVVHDGDASSAKGVPGGSRSKWRREVQIHPVRDKVGRRLVLSWSCCSCCYCRWQEVGAVVGFGVVRREVFLAPEGLELE
jgi:hypothetical protein